jgi:hypothetical protein
MVTLAQQGKAALAGFNAAAQTESNAAASAELSKIDWADLLKKAKGAIKGWGAAQTSKPTPRQLAQTKSHSKAQAKNRNQMKRGGRGGRGGPPQGPPAEGMAQVSKPRAMTQKEI